MLERHFAEALDDFDGDGRVATPAVDPCRCLSELSSSPHDSTLSFSIWSTFASLFRANAGRAASPDDFEQCILEIVTVQAVVRGFLQRRARPSLSRGSASSCAVYSAIASSLPVFAARVATPDDLEQCELEVVTVQAVVRGFLQRRARLVADASPSSALPVIAPYRITSSSPAGAPRSPLIPRFFLAVASVLLVWDHVRLGLSSRRAR